MRILLNPAHTGCSTDQFRAEVSRFRWEVQHRERVEAAERKALKLRGGASERVPTTSLETAMRGLVVVEACHTRADLHLRGVRVA